MKAVSANYFLKAFVETFPMTYYTCLGHTNFTSWQVCVVYLPQGCHKLAKVPQGVITCKNNALSMHWNMHAIPNSSMIIFVSSSQELHTAFFSMSMDMAIIWTGISVPPDTYVVCPPQPRLPQSSQVMVMLSECDCVYSSNWAPLLFQ